MNNRYALAGLVAVAFLLTGCGAEEPKPAGPDVRGMSLPDARIALKTAGVEATVKAKAATFGVLIEDNFVVCETAYVNPQMTRLEVSKHGC